MSYILAIDTSTDACSVAISTPEGVEQKLSIAPREHTQRVLTSVETLLSELELSLSQLDAIAFGVGPGSFTGLRIALSHAQGLAYGADLPLVPVSTLAAMAHTAWRLNIASASQVVMPVIDARMNEVYCAAYRQESDKHVVCLQEETIISPEDLTQAPWLTALERPVGVGSGWHYECLSSLDTQQVRIEAYPEAHDIALMAAHKLAVDGSDATISPLSAAPSYMRNEISWKKRQRIREKML